METIRPPRNIAPTTTTNTRRTSSTNRRQFKHKKDVGNTFVPDNTKHMTRHFEQHTTTIFLTHFRTKNLLLVVVGDDYAIPFQ
jgi:hypothetical protein